MISLGVAVGVACIFCVGLMILTAVAETTVMVTVRTVENSENGRNSEGSGR
jgi:hypothetical protein